MVLRITTSFWLYLMLSLLIWCFEAPVEPATRQAGFGARDKRGIERSFKRARLSLSLSRRARQSFTRLRLFCWRVTLWTRLRFGQECGRHDIDIGRALSQNKEENAYTVYTRRHCVPCASPTLALADTGTRRLRPPEAASCSPPLARRCARTRALTSVYGAPP